MVNVTDLPFSQTMGTCKIPTALRFELGPATETGRCCSNFENLRWGCCLATVSACFWLTKETEQQLSKGRGRETPAEVIFVHKMFLFARSNSETDELLGKAVIAGIPKRGSCVVAELGCAAWGCGRRFSTCSMRVAKDLTPSET